MYLKSLKINNFRNIKNSQINFLENFNIIIGDNGNGKTNLIEAVYYLTSLRTIKKKNKLLHLINENSDFAILEGLFKNNTLNETVRAVITPQKRSLIHNNNTIINIKEYLFKFRSILFTPDDLMIIKGEPENRRDFFNKAIFTLNPYYYDYLLNYNNILKSRNMILKSINEGNKKNTMLLRALNEQFTDISIKIYNERMNFLIDFVPFFIETVNQLSNKELMPYLVYKTEFNYKSPDEYLKKLTLKQEREIKNKRTLFGPHLDDYKILKGNNEIKFYGSQGEIRIFTLALKISLINLIYKKSKKLPILLLDDISSELDETRKKYLFNYLKTINTQVFITTTELKNIPNLKHSKIIKVNNGRLQ